MKYLWMLFLRSLILSATTTGGGFVIIESLRRIYVDKLKLISEKEMTDITALAQISPGAVSVNASVILGYRLAGFSGALASLTGTVIPPLVIMMTISYFYEAVHDIEWIGYVMTGMQAGVSAVILTTAVRITKNSHIFSEAVSAIVFSVSIVILLFTSIPTYILIPTAAFAGLIHYYISFTGRLKKQ